MLDEVGGAGFTEGEAVVDLGADVEEVADSGFGVPLVVNALSGPPVSFFDAAPPLPLATPLLLTTDFGGPGTPCPAIPSLTLFSAASLAALSAFSLAIFLIFSLKCCTTYACKICNA